MQPKHPYLSAFLCAAAQFVLTVLIIKVGPAVAPQAGGLIRLAAFGSTLLLPFVLCQALGLWKQVGLDRIRPNALFWLSLVSCLFFLVRGVRMPEGSSLAGTVGMQFLNAFGEELLFRGVIFALLASVPRWQGVLVSGLLFGSMHLIHGVMEGDWPAAFAQMLVTSASGFMFAAVRYGTGSLWLCIALHMLLNLSIIHSNLEPAAGATTYFVMARVANAFECAFALYVVLRATKANPGRRGDGETMRA